MSYRFYNINTIAEIPETNDMDVIGKAILNEKDPILREVWDLGYYRIDELFGKYRLFHRTEKVKEISYSDWHRCMISLEYKHAILIDGTEHVWVKEADGSAARLRELIKLDY